MTYDNVDNDSDRVIEGDVDNESTVTDDLQAQSASVESEPSDDTDIVRKLEADKKADLDTGKGVLKSSQVPDLAITSVQTVPDESSRLNLSVQEGDVAVQTNTSTTYIFTGGDPSVNNNWSEIVLDVIDAIQGSTISPENVVTQSVNTENTIISNSDSQSIQNEDDPLNAIGFDSFSLGDNKAQQIFTDRDVTDTNGFLIVVANSTGRSAEFVLQGGRDAVLESDDPGNAFSDSLGADDSINVGFDGSRYAVENKRGGVIDLRIIGLF